MNVIGILSDEHSYRMMRFIAGGLLRTPNLERLAAESVVFDNCYSPCLLCALARASFMTGQFVNRIGTWDNSTPYDDTVPGISQHLAHYGKRFACIGKTHFHHAGEYGFAWQAHAGYMQTPDIGCYFRGRRVARLGAQRRFEEVGVKQDAEPIFDDRVLQAALEWLDQHSREENWMLYVGFTEPHFPLYVKKEHWNEFNEKIRAVPDALKPTFTSLNEPLEWMRTCFQCEDVPEETVRRILEGYCCAVEELDEYIGALLDKTESQGLNEASALFYSSDHGEQLSYHGMWWKCTMFEQSAHVPLIVWMPGAEPRRSGHPVNLTDLFAAVCDWMEVPRPQETDNYSLLPLICRGRNEFRPDFTFSEYNAYGIPHRMFMIRWKQYKYVYFCSAPAQLLDLEQAPREDRDLLSEQADDPWVCRDAQECRKRLYQVCDPQEVDAHALEYPSRMKDLLGLKDCRSEKGEWVPHPENWLGFAGIPNEKRA